MKGVLCDASPLIFLAKLDHLDLISRLLGSEIFILQCVADELLSKNVAWIERERLSRFIKTVHVIPYEIAATHSTALSLCDQSSLRWAIEQKIDYFLVDERLLRRVAIEEGLSVLGFLGLLISATTQKILSPKQVRKAINDAVSQHSCRISVPLYQRVMLEIQQIENCRQ